MCHAHVSCRGGALQHASKKISVLTPNWQTILVFLDYIKLGGDVQITLKQVPWSLSRKYSQTVRGRSTSSDVSSDISPSPLYIPPHRRQPKTEWTCGSDTGVRWSRDVTFLSLFHHSPSFSSFHYFFIILLFPLWFLVYRHASHLSRALSFLLGSPARCAFLSYLCLYICLGSPARSRLSRPQLP